MRFFLHLGQLIFLSCCMVSSAYALENVTLQLNGTHAFQFAGYYAAKEEGYYRDVGLEVNLEKGTKNTNSVSEVTKGRAQFGVGTSSLLLARAAGKSVVALAVIFQHSPYVIYAPHEIGINTLSDLYDKKILLGSQSDELLILLRRAGILPNHIQRINKATMPSDLTSGKADAISGRFSSQPYYFNHEHFAYQTFSPLSEGIDFYGDNLFTSEQELQHHPQRVHAFVEASLRGWRYAKEHPDEIISLILSKYTEQHPRAYLQFEANAIIPLLQADLGDIGDSNPEHWKNIARTYADAGLLDHNTSIDGFIYNPQSEKNSFIQRSMDVTLLQLTLISLGIIFVYRINSKLGLNLKELKNIHKREQARNYVLDLLFKDAPLTDILEAIVKSIEAEDPSSLCSILLMDDDGKHLNVGAAPSLPDFYNTAINGLAIGYNVGSCGATAHLGKRTVVDNILTHRSWAPYKELATQAGLGSCWSEPIFSSGKKILGTFAIYHRKPHHPLDKDIERIERAAHLTGIAIEKTQSQQKLQANDLLLSKISSEVPGIIFQFRKHPDGRYTFPFISEAVRKMYGLSPDDLRKDATPFFGFRHPEDANRVAKSIEISARNLSRWHIEYRITLPSQGTRWRLGDAQPERLEDGSIIWHGFITDITDRKNTEERIQHMAQYDALTDLPNRALFSDRLQQTLATAKRDSTHFALLFLDFDKFKPINDALGHAIGDELLKRASLRMQTCMRESDTIARIGGDEFVALLQHTDAEQDAVLVAEKIRHVVETPFEINGYLLNISASIGIAMYPQHGTTEIELSKNADLAMYYAKQKGRNTVMVYHSQMYNVGQ